MTAVASARPGSTRVRHLYQIPNTPTEPPYDDEPQAGTWAARPPVDRDPAPIVLALPDSDLGDLRQRVTRDVPAQPRSGPRTAGTRDNRSAPSARAVATVVVRAMVEAMTGIRPAAHLAAWTTPHVQADLERLAADNVRQRRYTLRCVRVCEPRDGIAEVAAVIACGERACALALRMETSDGRWRVTALQTG
ncbi:Rv3235 family protein [Frankia sp. Cppng1_Ct_nod]|uniref:Rv3235 family protein n=1 Tax=Frankia sp. Cppng1_Ct_nod TaxID=2897162 RepID=UPI001040ED41|nr:Rv3235 family protein [Frankia sp. Cppng1_Ct_nod]